MAKPITASDRSRLIKLASGLPKGSDERKAILAGLRKTSGGGIGEFTSTDWRSYIDAQAWGDSDPLIATFDVAFPWETLKESLQFAQDDYPVADKWDIVMIADVHGVQIEFQPVGTWDQGPMFGVTKTFRSAKDAERVMEAAIRALKSGKIPRGFSHDN